MRQYIQIAGSALLGIFLLAGCRQPSSPSDAEAKRASIDQMASSTIATLETKHPELKGELKDSLGYLVVDWKTIKLPIVGGGSAHGLVYEASTNKRTYVKVSLFDLGAGWGVRRYKSLVVIDSQKIMDKAIKGTWEFSGGGEGTVGNASAGLDTSDIDMTSQGYKAYTLVDGGASITATINAMHLKKDRKLN